MSVVSNGLAQFDALEKWQARALRWMTGISVAVHACGLLLASALAPLFPAPVVPPVVMVELTEAPPSVLPAEEPPPVSTLSPAQSPEASPFRKAPTASPRKIPSSASAEKWLRKLDARLASVTEAPVSRDEGRHGGIPVRHWKNEGPVRPGDFAPAVAPEGKILRRQISDIEGRVRRVLVPGITDGKESEAEVMFGRDGSSGGETIPEWIRDMIRRKVRGYLPELETSYSAAYRRNPDLQGRLLVRFRIDSSGRVVTAHVESVSFHDDFFVKGILQKIRNWNFDPTDGRMVEVLYPFAFIAPS